MKEFDELVKIMATLRGEKGCPWDREQTHETLVPYLIEEAYEVIEALSTEDAAHVCEELGDLMLQIVFHAQIAREEHTYSIENVLCGIRDKLIRRHPHVFGGSKLHNADEVVLQWNEIKKNEKTTHGKKKKKPPIPGDLPALQKALKLQNLLTKRGFCDLSREKSYRALEEALAHYKENPGLHDLQQLSGIVLFHAVNLARCAGADPEVAVRRACSNYEHLIEEAGEESLCQKKKNEEEGKDV
jgi:tetrapyrrole methylase family protein/MazG family protein